MPVVHSEVNTKNKPSVHKGILYLMGVGAFVLLWLIGYGSNMLVYNTLSVFPIIIPIVVAIPVAWLVDRISKVYPGSAAIFAYAAVTLISVIIAVITLITLSNGQSWLDIGVTNAVISLVYPLVAIGYARWLEVFVDKLGLKDGGDSKLEHYDTIKARLGKEATVTKFAPRGDKKGFNQDPKVETEAKIEKDLVAKERYFGDSLIVVAEDGDMDIMELDLDALEKSRHLENKIEEKEILAVVPEKPEVTAETDIVAPVVKPKPVRKPAVKKPVAKSNTVVTKTSPTPRKAPARKPVAKKIPDSTV